MPAGVMDGRLFDLIRQGATTRQLQLILDTGADVNAHNERQETPLMTAMINIHKVTRRCQIVEILLANGANINYRNLRGQTALMYACILNQPDMLDILLVQPTLDCNIQDFEGNTAFMYACALVKTESVRKLVCAYQHGVEIDPHVANVEGATAFDYAMDSKDEEIQDLVATITMETVDSQIDETETHSVINDSDDIKGVKEGSKTSKRIKQLACSLEGQPTDDEKSITIWKGTDDGDVSIVSSKTDPTSSMESMARKKSVLNVHIPRTNDELVDGDFPDTSEFHAVEAEEAEKSDVLSDENIQTITKDMVSCTIAPKPKKSRTHSEKAKRGKHGKKSKRRKHNKKSHTSEDIDRNAFLQEIQPTKREFGEEIAFGNKIYETETKSDETDGEAEVAKMERLKIIMKDVTDRALMNFHKGMPNVVREASDNTGKHNYMDLSPKERGKLLSRTIWSVYGEPLPPIPITSTTLDRVIRGVTTLKRFLGTSRYQPGRLLSLDPELWCLVESMRSR